jgi:hypothetical protein
MNPLPKGHIIMQTLALQINEATLPLITLLNNGVEPGRITFGKYYVCDIEGTDTSNRKFISMEEYRNTYARKAPRFDVNHVNH